MRTTNVGDREVLEAALDIAYKLLDHEPCKNWVWQRLTDAIVTALDIDSEERFAKDTEG